MTLDKLEGKQFLDGYVSLLNYIIPKATTEDLQQIKESPKLEVKIIGTNE